MSDWVGVKDRLPPDKNQRGLCPFFYAKLPNNKANYIYISMTYKLFAQIWLFFAFSA